MNLDRTKAPAFHPIPDFPLVRPYIYRLSNGITVYYMEGGTQPVVRFQAIFDAGRWYEKQKGNAYFTAKMLTEGTKKHTSEQIHELIDFYGASFFVFQDGDDKLVMTTECLSKFLPDILAVFTEILTEASFPEKEWDILQNNSLQQIRINLEKNAFLANCLLGEYLFGTDHPYGYWLNEEIIANYQLDSVRSHYEDYIYECPFEVLIAGKLDERAKNAMLRQLESLPVRKSEAKRGFQGDCTACVERKVYRAREKSLQTSLRIGTSLFPANHPDRIAFTVLNEVLGGYFGSRLMQNLREEKGYTYSIYSATAYLLRGSYFFISTDVIKEHKDHALEEIYKEIATLKTQPIEKEELDKVKSHIAGSYIKAISHPFGMADYYFKMVLLNKLSPEHCDEYISMVNAIEPEQLLAVANRYLQESSFVEIAVG
ncbi:MAG: insulinase family protein [Flammeovirgaceae bacterium]|nr:insulinase family protein [Flammeovirgaceae bacterium]MDW8286906.1 pitrilysin family protein [Flammeovirgaceae bacterium]